MAGITVICPVILGLAGRIRCGIRLAKRQIPRKQYYAATTVTGLGLIIISAQSRWHLRVFSGWATGIPKAPTCYGPTDTWNGCPASNCLPENHCLKTGTICGLSRRITDDKKEWKKMNYSEIRGFNYQPGYAATGLETPAPKCKV